MRPLLSTLCVLASTAALAAPPSSHLSSPEGSLAWTVSSSGDVVTLRGRSPTWTVEHTADANLRPKATTRTNPDGSVVTVRYDGNQGVITMANGKTHTHAAANLWDGDTLDVRLGHAVATGQSLDFSFKAVDTGSGKLYGFDVVDAGADTCGTGPCRHVHVTLAGWLKVVGPSFDYWYASDGRLVRFKGPAGSFNAK